MHDFTVNWHWPQWTMLALMLIRFSLHAAKHGSERLETGGERKGLPERYNGFSALSWLGIMAFTLIAGGFFA